MPIIFTETTGLFPFEVETVGVDWLQEPITRPEGYHTYHLLEGKVGTGLVTLNQQKINLDVGDLLLISPHIPHHYHGTSQTLWQTNFLTFLGDSSYSLDKFFDYQEFILLKNNPVSFLEKIFTQLEHVPTSAGRSRASSLLLYELLSDVKEKSTAKNKLMTHTISSQLMPVINYIKQHFAQEISLNELAQQIFVSPQYLIRLFKKQLNCSPNDYLINQRIKHAKTLLIEQPEKNISEIGESCGFNSSSYFIKVFKQLNQLTPKQFREKYKH